ncbi:MAG: HXXEE domain-containing protein, partial [Bacteroidota bacterium]
GLLGILASPRHLFPLICMASIVVVNGVVHILAAISTLRYNPGLLTSVVLFLPLYGWFLKSRLEEVQKPKRLIVAGLVWAFLAHVIMVAGLLMANWFKLFPEAIYFAVLIVWSILPITLYRPGGISNSEAFAPRGQNS